MSDFDVIVLGGGSAGTSAARAASREGARTALINDGELGGLCILRGCMPTKAMLASAHLLHEMRHAEPLGIRLEGRAKPDFTRIMARKDAQVKRFQEAKIKSVDAQEYEVIFGRASFAPGGGISVNGKAIRARRYVIATGSVPVIPELPGIDGVPYLTSDDVMRLEKPPESLVVLGSGPVGLELAQFFARIGTEVLLVSRSPLLTRFDADCGEELTRAFKEEERLDVLAPASIRGVKRDGSSLLFDIESEGRTREHRAESFLVATGRRAAVDGLGLENAGLALRAGRLEHDPAMRTANPDIFVAGDTTGDYQILHLANQEGTVAGVNAAGVTPERVMDYRLKMSVIYTDPPFAHVGMTEAEIEKARAAGRRIVVAKVRTPRSGRAITMGAEFGLWKLWADGMTCELLGSAILGPRADDLIHLVSQMLYFGGTGHDIPRLPWYHPTLSELMINLGRGLASQVEGCEMPPLPPA